MKLVDTSSWIEYLRGNPSEAGDRLQTLILNDDAAWCDLTLVELWHGVRGAKEKREMADLEKEIKRISLDASVWELAFKLALRCRDKGFTFPTSDIVIAACAVAKNLELEHCDKHFDTLVPLAKEL